MLADVLLHEIDTSIWNSGSSQARQGMAWQGLASPGRALSRHRRSPPASWHPLVALRGPSLRCAAFLCLTRRLSLSLSRVSTLVRCFYPFAPRLLSSALCRLSRAVVHVLCSTLSTVSSAMQCRAGQGRAGLGWAGLCRLHGACASKPVLPRAQTSSGKSRFLLSFCSGGSAPSSWLGWVKVGRYSAVQCSA